MPGSTCKQKIVSVFFQILAVELQTAGFVFWWSHAVGQQLCHGKAWLATSAWGLHPTDVIQYIYIYSVEPRGAATLAGAPQTSFKINKE